MDMLPYEMRRVGGLPSLTSLNVSGCRTRIDNDWLAGLTTLRKLTMQVNNMEYVQEDILHAFSNLTWLDCGKEFQLCDETLRCLPKLRKLIFKYGWNYANSTVTQPTPQTIFNLSELRQLEIYGPSSATFVNSFLHITEE